MQFKSNTIEQAYKFQIIEMPYYCNNTIMKAHNYDIICNILHDYGIQIETQTLYLKKKKKRKIG